MSKVLAVIVSAVIPISAASAKVVSHRHHRHHTRHHVPPTGGHNVLPPGATGVYCFNTPDTPPAYAGAPSVCIPQFQ
jgi:hypothetical protein